MTTLADLLRLLGAEFTKDAHIEVWMELVDDDLVVKLQDVLVEAEAKKIPAKRVIASIGFYLGATMAKNIQAQTPTDLCEMLSSIGDFVHAIGHAEYEAMRQDALRKKG
jgi:hypothetical protein